MQEPWILTRCHESLHPRDATPTPCPHSAAAGPTESQDSGVRAQSPRSLGGGHCLLAIHGGMLGSGAVARFSTVGACSVPALPETAASVMTSIEVQG